MDANTLKNHLRRCNTAGEMLDVLGKEIDLNKPLNGPTKAMAVQGLAMFYKMYPK